jgi:hypothetical protein
MKKYNIEVIIPGFSYDLSSYMNECDLIEERLLNQIRKSHVENHFNITFKIQLKPTREVFESKSADKKNKLITTYNFS